MYANISDGDLISLISEGNHDAFAEIVKRHTDRFFALAFRTLQNKGDAEDVVQASFIKLWQKPQSWDSNKSLFTTWFYRVVVNACHDHRRKYKRELDVDDTIVELSVEPVTSEQINYEEQQIVAWRSKCLEVAISRLPASQKDAINLVVYSELPQKQAAEIMNVSLKALESLLVRAKRSMAKTVNQLSVESELLSRGISGDKIA
ncbi:MAG: sigma-70 family RNA polymerase sigma factor [Acidiferrobacterales bacterium]|nr:sigma-70 family RNA polymerase sigma factor [Acidiferrobacterales bacterium]